MSGMAPDLDSILRTVAQREPVAQIVAERGLPRIKWRRPGRPGARPRCWASYGDPRALILVSPALQTAPDYVLRHIVYHELIHHCGLWDHNDEFRALETACPDYVRTHGWIDGAWWDRPWT